MSCISIQIINLPHSIPQDLTDSGFILIDLSPEFDLTTIQEDSEFTVKGFRNDTTLEATAPQSPTNKAIFEPLISSNLFQIEQCVYLEINALRCGLSLDFSHIRVTGRIDSSCQYTFELTNKINHPLELAKSCKLCEIPDLGEFELTKENIEATWPLLENGWIPGADCFVWPIEWFGDTYLPNQFTPEDLRPRFNPFALLQKAYCKIGVNLQTPFLQDPKWRKTWMYLSDKSFGGNANINLENYKLKASSKETTFSHSDLPLSAPELGAELGCKFFEVPLNVELDPNLQIQGNSIKIDPCIVADYCFEYRLRVIKGIKTIDSINVFAEAYLTTNKTISQSLSYSISSVIASDDISTQTSFIDDPTNNRYMIVSGKVTVGCDLFKNHSSFEECLLFRLKYCVQGKYETDPNVLGIEMTLQYSCVTSVPKRLKYCEGDIIQMSQTLDCNKTIYDLTESLAHMTGSKIDWKSGSRVLDIRPAFDVDGLDGHYKEDEQQDLSDYVIKDSLNNRALEKFQQKCQIRGFKKSSDPCITTDSRYQDLDQPYDKKIDFGAGFQDGCNEDRNKCIEPTVLTEVFSHSFGVNDEVLPAHLTCLTDNAPDSEGNQKISYDICWRIGIGYYVPTQEYLDEFGNVIGEASINWCGDQISGIPSFYQLLDGENVGLPGINPEDCAIVYGDHEEELWTKYIGREFVGRFLTNKVTFQLHLCCADLFKIDKRKLTTISYKGFQYYGFIDTIQNNLCTERTTLTLNSPNQVLGICVDRPTGNGGNVDPVICENFPEIDCEVVDGCLILMLGGINNSIPSMALFEYCLLVDDGNGGLTSEVDPNTGEAIWQEATPTSNISAQICDLDCPVKLSMAVDYEYDDCECPECGSLQANFVADLTNNQLTWQLFVAGSIVATVDGNTVNGTNGVNGQSGTNSNVHGFPVDIVVEDNGCTHTGGGTYTIREFGQDINTVIILQSSGTTDCDCEPCPSVKKIITKDPCGNSPEIRIECEYDDQCRPCFTVFIEGDIQSMIDEIEATTNVGAINFNIAADGLSAQSDPICLDTGDTFTLETLEISWQDPCKPFILLEPLTRVKPNQCCCDVQGECIDCLYQFSEKCERKVVWYQMKGFTDPNVIPFGLTQETPIIDNEIKEEIKCSYPIYGPETLPFDDQLKIWYIGILSKPGCECILYSYYHSPFIAGGDPHTKPTFDPRPQG